MDEENPRINWVPYFVAFLVIIVFFWKDIMKIFNGSDRPRFEGIPVSEFLSNL